MCPWPSLLHTQITAQSITLSSGICRTDSSKHCPLKRSSCIGPLNFPNTRSLLRKIVVPGMEHIQAGTVGQPLSLQNISALSRLERHRAPARVDLLQVDTPFHELSPRTVTAHLGAKSPSVYSWSRYDRSGVVRERGSGRLTAILQLRVHCRGAATADSATIRPASPVHH